MSTLVTFVKDRENGEIVAIFPEAMHGRFEYSVVCYTHNEQHSACDKQWAYIQEEPTISEVVDLFNELVDIGYDNLKLIKL